MDIVPLEGGLVTPRSQRGLSWNLTCRHAESEGGELPQAFQAFTPRPSSPSIMTPQAAPGRQFIQHAVAEIVRDFDKKIGELARLTTDLPNRLRMIEEMQEKISSKEVTRSRITTSQSVDEVSHQFTDDEGDASLNLRPEWAVLTSEGSMHHDEAIVHLSPECRPLSSCSSLADGESAWSLGKEQTNVDVISHDAAKSVKSHDTARSKARRKGFGNKEHRSQSLLFGGFRLGAGALPSQWKRFVRPKAMTNAQWDADAPKATQMAEYEFLMGIVISANVVYMGIELQYAGENVGKELDPSQIGALIFAAIYLFDLLARLHYERYGFFYGPEVAWNIMDSLVVLSALIDQFLRIFDSDGSLQTLVVLRALRLLRLLRILHIVRFLKHFKEFRLLMYSLLRAFRAMFWTLTLCSLNVYIFSVAVAQGSMEYCDASTLQTAPCQAFGTLSEATLNMYKTMFGGIIWGDLLELLAAFGYFYQSIYLFYIAFTMTIILNLCTGVVLDIVQDTVHKERDVVIDSYLHDKLRYVSMMQAIFDELDVDGSGGICMDELVYATKNLRMMAWLESMGIDLSEVEDIFHMLDRDRKGTIDIEDFVLGCMRLKGGAKTIDVMKLQLRSEWVMLNVGSLQEKVDRFLETQKHSNGISKAEATDLDAMTASNTHNHPELNIPREVQEADFQHWQVIGPAEMRAMMIRDLRSTLRFARSQRETYNWSGSDGQGDGQARRRINLYDLNYYCISPYTVPQGVYLHGLKQREYCTGERIIQRYRHDSSRELLAVGNVLELSQENIVHVAMVQGRFREAANECGSSELCVMIGEEDLGMPSKVDKPVSLSWKELAFPRAAKPRWFCSHWWGEPISDFVACCVRHAALRGMPDEEASYWVCAYANRQHDLAGDISGDPDESSFRKAMHVAQGTLLLLDDEATPFRRIWCDFELYHTICDDKPLDIVTGKSVHGKHEPQVLTQGLLRGETSYDKIHREETFPLSLLVVGLKTKLEDGDASVQSDKDAILRSMARKHGGSRQQCDAETLALALKTANAKLHSYLAIAAWPQALKKARVNNFDLAGTLSLPHVLSQDDSMENMNLSFAHMDEMTDSAIKHVADGVPRQITRLQLSFEGCATLTDQGVISLAENLPSTLEVVFLNFVGCQKITDFALIALAQHLPLNLRELRLDFAHCEQLGHEGVKALADNLPGNLKRFVATFQGTHVDRKFRSARELQRFARRSVPGSSASFKDLPSMSLSNIAPS